jgi:carbamoyltransferase
MRIYLGTNFGHGSAAAAISEEGEMLYAVEEGKLIGEKNTSRFPAEALSYMVRNIEGNVDIWAEGWNPGQRLIHKGIISTAKYGLRDPAYFRDSFLKELGRFSEGQLQFKRWKQQLGPIHSVGHHLAHAYSLLPAGLPPSSLVLVSDTTAERSSISSYYFSGREMILLTSSLFPHSIGAVFHQLAYHLGFQGRTGPGKLMALAAFGKPDFLEYLKQIAEVKQGIFQIDMNKFPAWRRNGSWLAFSAFAPNELRDVIRRACGSPEQGIDLAASAQAWFTEITWACITQSLYLARKKMGIEIPHLGLAGGAALNCRANGEFLLKAPNVSLDTITISPWSDDSGTAIGAAVWGLTQRGIADRIRHSCPFLGTAAILGNEVPDDNEVHMATRCLVAGKVVALASGRLEFGPRALGGRCLLADPRRDELRHQLNRMKSRPEFMPIAPVVLEQDYSRYFEGLASGHMAWTVMSKQTARREIPAAVHCDGHSRVQLLKKDDAPLLERVLQEFKRETGHGVLLLTSLNGTEEAIPCDLNRAETIACRLGTSGILSDAGWNAFG